MYTYPQHVCTCATHTCIHMYCTAHITHVYTCIGRCANITHSSYNTCNALQHTNMYICMYICMHVKHILRTLLCTQHRFYTRHAGAAHMHISICHTYNAHALAVTTFRSAVFHVARSATNKSVSQVFATGSYTVPI